MYKETLEILMEGITCPIKEQILKNQLEYHFKNKTPENQNAIDNSTTIVRRVLENMNIFDLISVQPITNSQVDIDTITNPDDDEVDTNSFNYRIFYPNADTDSELENEINFACACEIEDSITKHIIDEMLEVAPTGKEINLNSLTGHFLNLDIIAAMCEVDAEWAIVSPIEAAIIRTHPLFVPSNVSKTGISSGLMYLGSMHNLLHIYTSLNISDTILFGSNDDECPPLTYAPENMVAVGESNTDDRHELVTSSEIFIDEAAVKQRYRKISIKYEY